MTTKLAWMAAPARGTTAEPWACGRPRSLSSWGPDRFARGAMEALDSRAHDSGGALALTGRPRRQGDKPMIGAHATNMRRPASVAPALCGRRRDSSRTRPARWLHLCNGLDPVRDGGMVPSILGMTGALSRRQRRA